MPPVSSICSAKITETGAAAQKMNEALAGEKFRANNLQRQLFGYIAESYVNYSNVLHFEENLEPALVRDLADAIADRVSGMAAVFSGNEETGYSYCLVSRSEDLRSFGKAMNQSLSGRGGGKSNFQQGRVSAGKAAIEAFFRERMG